MNKDQTKGAIKDATGKMQAKAGQPSGNSIGSPSGSDASAGKGAVGASKHADDPMVRKASDATPAAKPRADKA
jgi:uncharacterized protein YjbJ (UPF0337 family)